MWLWAQKEVVVKKDEGCDVGCRIVGLVMMTMVVVLLRGVRGVRDSVVLK